MYQYLIRDHQYIFDLCDGRTPADILDRFITVLVNYMFTFPINPSDGSVYMYIRMHIKLFSTANVYTMLFLHLIKTAPICQRCLHACAECLIVHAMAHPIYESKSATFVLICL